MSYPKLMVHEGKHEHRHILIEHSLEEGPAYLAMFLVMDRWDSAYDCISGTEAILYAKAKHAETMTLRCQAAKALIWARNGVEYEHIYITGLETPGALMERFDAST